LAFKSNEKTSTTHYAKGNIIATPTQTVVGKGIPNSLITEGLLKILRVLILPSPSKFLTNSHPWNGRTKKAVIVSPLK